MKRIIETTESDGLEKLLGEFVQLWCINYIYAGRLIGVNKEDCVLEDAVLVYETGELGSPKFKEAQAFGTKELFVRLGAIEAYALAPQLQR